MKKRQKPNTELDVPEDFDEDNFDVDTRRRKEAREALEELDLPDFMDHKDDLD